MKNILINIIKTLLKIFYIFPIKNNRVVFSAYLGKNYSCNPKYICEWLLKNSKNLEIVWAFRNPQKIIVDEKIKKIKFKSIKYIFYVLTARVVVDNVESWSILPKRKNQEIINTWHGGGAYKGVGKRRLDTNRRIDKNMLSKNKRVTTYLSSSEYFTELTLKQSFGYKGKVLNSGMPRNDLLINKNLDLILSLKKQFGIENKKIVIYAPTFRKNSYEYELDFKNLVEALKNKYGGQWVVLFRAHYYLTCNFINDENIIDVSTYPDMQELLLISDILITDYSSSIWDFALMGKTAFLFVPDLKKYTIEERSFYLPIEEWPYYYAENNKDLIKLILNLNEKEQIEKIERHLTRLKSFEKGQASESVGNYILSEISRK